MSDSNAAVNGSEVSVTKDGATSESANPPKTAKQLEKDAKKQAKLDKLKQKQEKQAQAEPKEKPQVSNLKIIG